MKTKGFVLTCMALIASMVTAGVAWSQDGGYGGAAQVPPGTAVPKPKKGLHGVTPWRSAFELREDHGTTIWRGGSGYFRQDRLAYVGPLTLNTPFGNHIPGSEYKNESSNPSSPLSPQTFWISNGPINGPYYVVAWSDKDKHWYGFTEDAVGGELKAARSPETMPSPSP